MEKILIIGPAWVGDMVIAQSLFKLLKQRNPEAILHVAAPAWTVAIVARMPEVTAVTALPFAHHQLNLLLRYQIARQLRQAHFTSAIVLPNSFKSALIPWLARIPKRSGWGREGRFLLLNDARKLDKKRYPLLIERFLALALPKGEALPSVYPYPQLTTSAAAQAAALAKLGLVQPRTPVLALCPGAEFGSSKRWPEEYYAELAKQKLAAGWQVWLLGSPKDKAVTTRIMDLTDHGCVDLAGRTNLEDAVDLLAVATAVVSNDSGLMHVAAAVNRPLVAMYGSSSPAYTPPLTANAVIQQLSLPCQPCFKRECPLQHHRCMRDLSPAQVAKALAELVNE